MGTSADWLPARVEKEIRQAAVELGFVDTPLRQQRCREIELVLDQQHYVYISRCSGGQQNVLKVVVSAEDGEVLDSMLDQLTGTTVRTHRAENPRLFFSSDYSGLVESGKSRRQHEHGGYGYGVNIAQNQDALELFLLAITEIDSTLH
ncbi:hypothetical protein EDC56_1716 [Sinobacterium caligoides]|uniref:Uncharacterized protein n=1 Tax=Sinobacterium caligoides TaxID=933926 RepID=A0A3N2DNA0_9GAMM|nr:hypothetical protein [Sinobacterium caligoides]ROS01287.1 hypothetical protein EDC56_1716 [Sinobacterium caligoides]